MRAAEDRQETRIQAASLTFPLLKTAREFQPSAGEDLPVSQAQKGFWVESAGAVRPAELVLKSVLLERAQIQHPLLPLEPALPP